MDKIFINAKVVQIDKNNHITVNNDCFVTTKGKKIDKIDKMKNYKKISTCDEIDLKNRLISASLIDCHTHLIYGGNRTNEFEERLNGASYKQISKRGGGINASIKSTREEGFESIYEQSTKRLEALIKEGVTTIEIKTGYGLTLQSELKMLKIAEKLEKNYPIHIEKTFLGAHTVPPEYKEESDKYIEYVCKEMMPKIAPHVSSVDIYTEYLAFNLEQSKEVFKRATSLGLRVKVHAEQFSMMGATKLASSYQALSSDHLEYIDEESIQAMSKNATVAVLLPGAYYFLKETKKPPIELFRKYGVNIAIATDLNPGTSPLCSLQLMMNLGSVLFGLSVDEVFLGVTKNAANALGLGNKKGSLKVGYDADLCIWDCEHPRDLVGTYQTNRLYKSFKEAEEVYV